ncbi:alpha/beta hydrolase [soil metagenome]
MKRLPLSCYFAMLLGAFNAQGQSPTEIKPTQESIPYGTHERQVLDFYKATSDKPTPLLFFIHGGGWMNGDKKNPDGLKICLDANISVVSINYRLIPDAISAGNKPAVQWCLEDAARALQFVRSKAAEWNFDKTRVGGCGGSAGGFSTLWLAYHPDMADLKSKDPIAHESTRLLCALTFVPQTSLDPKQMRAWIPNNDYGHHAFALASMQEFIDKRDSLMPWIKDYSPYELVSADDPPVLLFYDSVPALGQPYKDPPHSANFGAGLVEKLKSTGVAYEFNYPGAPDIKYPNIFDFILTKLKAPQTK